MPAKKKKRRTWPSRKKIRAYLLVVLLILGCSCILAILIHLSSSARTGPLPVYEEPSPEISGFEKRITQINDAVYRSLYQRGIAENDISFSAVEPRNARDYRWDFTELLIRVADQGSIKQLKEIINDELKELSPEISVKTEMVSENEMSCHIFALEFHTHSILILRKTDQAVTGNHLPRIAFIIDDMGFDLKFARSVMKMEIPISLSVLPFAPYAVDIASAAIEDRSELLLHLPMEPKDFPGVDPGPGALLSSMRDDEIRRITNGFIQNVPGIKGVNNHMGSSFTEDRGKMAIVLAELKRQDLFFIDSRTSSQTVGAELAKKMGIPAAQRSVFLDNDITPTAIKYQLERLLGMARHSGKAIGIGHPHEETLKILNEYADKLQAEFEVVNVSELLD